MKPSAPLAWEPAAELRRSWEVNESCPECDGRPLITRGRGSLRVCPACQRRVMPPGVAAPYQRGGQAVRQVKSQRERDLEAIALAQRKGIMLSQLGALAADQRLHPESVPVVEWFAAEVNAAGLDDRLTELAELLPQAGIRHRRWWQSEPAAIETADYGDEYEDDEPENGDSDAVYGEDEGSSRAGPAKFGGQIGRAASMVQLDHANLRRRTIPEKSSLPDYSAELAARDWVIDPHGAGLCNLIHMRPHGWDGIPPEECIRRAEYLIAGAAICDSCFNALNQPIMRRI